MKKLFKTYAVIWAVLFAVFNAACFVIPQKVGGFEKYDVSFWIGYISVVIAFVIHYLCMYYVFKSETTQKTFYNISVFRTGLTGLIVMLVVGAIVMFVPFIPSFIALIVCVLVLGFTIVSVLKAKTAADVVSKIDENVSKRTDYIRTLTSSAEGLIQRAKTDDVKALCKKVYEAIRYSDPMSDDSLNVVETTLDGAYASFSAAVKSGATDNIAELADEVVFAVDDRNRECKLLKNKPGTIEADEYDTGKSKVPVWSILIPIILAIAALIAVVALVIIPKQDYNRALNLLEDGKYDEGYAILEKLGDTTAIENNKKERALALIDGEKFDEAYALYKELGDEEAILKNKADRADKLLADEKFDEAYALYEELGNSDAIVKSKSDRAKVLLTDGKTEDAYALFKEIGDTESINKNEYDTALKSIADGKFEDAYATLSALDYQDSEKVLFDLISEHPQIAKPGDKLSFGAFEQNNDTSEAEALTWIVLKNENGALTLITQSAVDYMKFNKDYAANATWKDSSLRAWLNGEFFTTAFDAEQQAKIAAKDIVTGEITTSDKVFLLSKDEATSLFESEEARKCEDTAYAQSHKKGDTTGVYWWLRSGGYDADDIALVDGDGGLNELGRPVNDDNIAVRPVIVLNVK